MSGNKTSTMQRVVTTKYYGPTNTRGARVKVSTGNGSKFVPFDHGTTWDGINGAGVAKVTAELMQDKYATEAGYTYSVTEVKRIGGPEDDLRYWIVTYTVTWE